MRSVIVIPARWASTRFPGKPLAPIAGMSLIQRVHERAVRSRRASDVYVATDDDRIATHVTSFGGNVLAPQGDFHTGTDRIAAALRLVGDRDFDVVVNVQGDEPLIDIATVDALIDLLAARDTEMATMACPLTTDEEFNVRDVVKVVTDAHDVALYFSRAPIGSRDTALRHIGVYAYRRDALERFVALAPSPLERAESLEQLRALQHGLKIAVLRTTKPHLGVDRPEDVARVESELAKLHS
ncbi:MAG TPA: 3-deoxy-manno-octulosonate cytidylyltransferase [Thermoanaerobaculia bacterium]|nr:3-deoxy-manno-octulosonate cytidylyltransferase [Thermoanaerobaculia bacterium]